MNCRAYFSSTVESGMVSGVTLRSACCWSWRLRIWWRFHRVIDEYPLICMKGLRLCVIQEAINESMDGNFPKVVCFRCVCGFCEVLRLGLRMVGLVYWFATSESEHVREMDCMSMSLGFIRGRHLRKCSTFSARWLDGLVKQGRALLLHVDLEGCCWKQLFW